VIKVSVIVPVYNAEPYLCKCLDSIVNQTLKDIEIICVNDCSPDNSLTILRKYAEKDNRIRILDLEKNLGEAGARNSGLAAASGEYAGTVDPDDYIDLNYYEKLYLKAIETKADIVHANIKRKRMDSAREVIIPVKRIWKNIYSPTIHCLAVYRMDFLQEHSIEYPIGMKVSADAVFMVKALFFANKVEFVNDVFYYYIRRGDSASACIGQNVREFYGMPLVFEFINKTIADKEDYGHFFGYFFSHLLDTFARVTPEWRKVFVQDMIDIYKKRKYPIFLERKLSCIEDCDFENVDVLFKKLSDTIAFLQYPKIHINNLQNRKLYIWGAGAISLETLIQCDNNEWEVEAFLDSNKDLTEFNGYRVVPPQELLAGSDRDFFIIISSVLYANEIAQICEQAELKEGKDFWRPR